MPGRARRCLLCVAIVLGTVALAARAQGDESVPGKGQDTSPVVTGRVVDSEGKPIPGVTIWTWQTKEEQNRGAEPQPLAITGPDGTFVVRDILQPLPLLAACPPGWIYEQMRILRVRPPYPSIELSLRKATRISGRVVDKSGEPAAGVRIRAALEGRVGGCIVYGAIPPCENSYEPRSGVTDAEGRFAFEALDPGWWEIRVLEEDEDQIVRRRGAPGQDIEGVEFILTRKSVPVEGRIVDADGIPVAGASVTLSSSSETKTDAAGKFRFSGVLSGKKLLTVEHPDQGWIEQEVEIGERPARLDLQMRPVTLVQGRILGPDGAPLKKVYLQIGESSLDVAPDGTFQGALPPGEHEVLAESFEPEAIGRSSLIALGEPIDLELRLARPGTIRGRLTGLPLGMTGRVRLQENPEELRGTDEHGGYSLEGIAPGAWTLVASDDNARIFERQIHVEEGEVVTVDIDFPPLPSVHGRVLDPAGRPAAGTAVIFAQGEREIRAETDIEGIFVAWPKEGSWTIRAESEGFGLAFATVEVPGNAPVELPDLRLTRLVTVSGRVLGVDPEVVVARVWAQDENDLRQPWSEVDQDNRFSIPHLWPGTWTLSTDIDGRLVSTTLKIPTDTTEVHIDLDATAADVAEEP